MQQGKGQLITHLSGVRTSPKWTFSGRENGRTNSRPTTPGPGTYVNSQHVNNGSKVRSPSYGFGTSGRDLARAASAPGPGQYQPTARPRSATPSYGFGTSSRSAMANHGTPGPGQYQPNHSTSKQDAPKYTATPRRDLSASHGRSNHYTPGPGAYASSPSRPGSAKSPEWRFGTDMREKGNIQNTPGPGQYHQEGRETGPSYSVRAKTDLRTSGGYPGHAAATPGPGHYGGMHTQFGY